MHELKDLVPSFELCKLIPKGEFADSCFVRCFDDIGTVILCERENEVKTEGWHTIPAPTLHEIMAELSLCDVYCDTGWFCMVGDPDHWSIGNCECDLYVRNGTENKSPEAAALKVWLKLKGVENEQ